MNNNSLPMIKIDLLVIKMTKLKEEIDENKRSIRNKINAVE
jgi:hypothetical protein